MGLHLRGPLRECDIHMRLSSCILTLLLGISAFAAEEKPLANQKEKSSYGIGVNVGKRFRHETIDLDSDAFIRGIKDALAGKPLALSDAELTQVMETLRKDMETKNEQQAEKSKKSGDDYLAQNKTKEGVKTLQDGLQYKVLKEGNGPMPKETDTVTVHYKGALTDGTEFDSSYKRGEPTSFPVTGVIKGWTEALQKMKVGSKWQLTIPPDLAYGENSPTPLIPPNSVLVFEVELLGIGEPKK
jgi:FKBP-type peptidyl-prolyl cis-trans isomerase FklB